MAKKKRRGKRPRNGYRILKLPMGRGTPLPGGLQPLQPAKPSRSASDKDKN
jgi:hypothetical protein